MYRKYDKKPANWLSLLPCIITWLCTHEPKAKVFTLFKLILDIRDIAIKRLNEGEIVGIHEDGICYSNEKYSGCSITINANRSLVGTKKEVEKITFTVCYKYPGNVVKIPWNYFSIRMEPVYIKDGRMFRSEVEYLQYRKKKTGLLGRLYAFANRK